MNCTIQFVLLFCLIFGVPSFSLVFFAPSLSPSRCECLLFLVSLLSEAYFYYFVCALRCCECVFFQPFFTGIFIIKVLSWTNRSSQQTHISTQHYIPTWDLHNIFTHILLCFFSSSSAAVHSSNLNEFCYEFFWKRLQQQQTRAQTFLSSENINTSMRCDT